MQRRQIQGQKYQILQMVNEPVILARWSKWQLIFSGNYTVQWVCNFQPLLDHFSHLVVEEMNQVLTAGVTIKEVKEVAFQLRSTKVPRPYRLNGQVNNITGKILSKMFPMKWRIFFKHQVNESMLKQNTFFLVQKSPTQKNWINFTLSTCAALFTISYLKLWSITSYLGWLIWLQQKKVLLRVEDKFKRPFWICRRCYIN